MAFPVKFLGIFSIGWKDLGSVKDKTIFDGKDTIREFPICSICNVRIRVGKANGNLFRYCPQCKSIIPTKEHS